MHLHEICLINVKIRKSTEVKGERMFPLSVRSHFRSVRRRWGSQDDPSTYLYVLFGTMSGHESSFFVSAYTVLWCCLTRIPNQNFDLPQHHNGRSGSKNLILIRLCFTSASLQRACRREDILNKWGESKNLTSYTYLRSALSLDEERIFEARCIKQHAFSIDPPRDLHDFSNTHFFMFWTHSTLTSKKLETNQEWHSKLDFLVEVSSRGHLRGSHSA